MDKHKLARLQGSISIVLNTLLFAAKLWAGLLSGSVAIIADAWHTLSDSFTSLVVLVGSSISRKPPDREHPFGHGRMELIAALIIGVLLAVAGFHFLTDSIEKLGDKTTVVFPPLVLIITGISVVLKEAAARFGIWCYKKTGFQALKADGIHHRSDALSSLLILIGITAGRQFWWIDAVLGILVSLFIFHSAYEILKDTISPLLGQTPNKQLLEEVKKIANTECQSCQHIHHLHLHCYGDHRELTFHIRLDPQMTIREGHKKASALESAILEKLGIYATIHVEPDEYLP